MEFQKITADALNCLNEYFKNNRYPICDYTLPTVYMWRNFFETEYALCKNCLFLRHNNLTAGPAYLLPIGFCGEGCVIKSLLSFADDGRLTLCLVPEEELDRVCKRISELCPRAKLEISNDEGWSDYVYDAKSISNFSGKKYHGQKNHLNFFNKSWPDAQYTVLTPENAHLAAAFVRSLGLDGNAGDIERTEYFSSLEYLENYSSFPMSKGGFITVDGNIVALAVGEICGEYITIHIEKADRKYRGAYQAIFNRFLSNNLSDSILYVNREEDCGDEGLRYAKNAYHPIALLKKYTIEIAGIANDRF